MQCSACHLPRLPHTSRVSPECCSGNPPEPVDSPVRAPLHLPTRSKRFWDLFSAHPLITRNRNRNSFFSTFWDQPVRHDEHALGAGRPHISTSPRAAAQTSSLQLQDSLGAPTCARSGSWLIAGWACRIHLLPRATGPCDLGTTSTGAGFTRTSVPLPSQQLTHRRPGPSPPSTGLLDARHPTTAPTSARSSRPCVLGKINTAAEFTRTSAPSYSSNGRIVG